MEEVRIDWASAEVSKGELTVELQGEISKAWRAHFERTVQLLASNDFRDLEVKKDKVRVKHLEPGVEADLRYFLTAVVDQANSACAAEQAAADEDEPQGEDAQMTEAFRAFASPDRD